VADQTFYKSFSEKQLTGFGAGRRSRIERHRLALLHRYAAPPGLMFEIGPGHGTLGELAVTAGWTYTAVETSPLLIDVLRKKGLNVIESWTPPFPMSDAMADVIYADQILEHMRGIDDARQFTAEALRSLKPGGHFFVVVPNYLKERGFFWDVDYTHNFVTTPRRMTQLLYDGGFEILHMERAIGVSTGLTRDALSAAKVFVNLPGVDTLSRYTGTEELVFKIRKNLFETLTFVARKPPSPKPQAPSPKPQ
jgi:SAM-dependent methyltransferase